MALADDINNLPVTISGGLTGHYHDHRTIHAALKDHEQRLAEAGEYDSGWRDITASLGDLPGNLFIRRIGKEVTIAATNLRPPTTGTMTVAPLPTGYRPSRTMIGTGSEGGSMRPVYAFSYSPYAVEVRGIVTANSWVDFTVRFITDNPEPATEPGTPA